MCIRRFHHHTHSSAALPQDNSQKPDRNAIGTLHATHHTRLLWGRWHLRLQRLNVCVCSTQLRMQLAHSHKQRLDHHAHRHLASLTRSTPRNKPDMCVRTSTNTQRSTQISRAPMETTARDHSATTTAMTGAHIARQYAGPPTRPQRRDYSMRCGAAGRPSGRTRPSAKEPMVSDARAIT